MPDSVPARPILDLSSLPLSGETLPDGSLLVLLGDVPVATVALDDVRRGSSGDVSVPFVRLVARGFDVEAVDAGSSIGDPVLASSVASSLSHRATVALDDVVSATRAGEIDGATIAGRLVGRVARLLAPRSVR